MRASGFGRALRYAVRQAEVYILCIFAASFAVAIYEWFLINDPMTVTEVLAMVPGMVLYLSLLVILITGATAAQSWYSMLVSFGCRRRNAFLGNLAMNLMVIFQSMVLFEILAKVFSVEDGAFGVQAVLAVYLAVEGIAQMIGAATIRWGKAAYILMIAVVIAISLGTGFMIGYGGLSLQVSGSLMKIITLTRQWWIVLIGAAVCAAANFIGWCVVSRYEVKIA